MNFMVMAGVFLIVILLFGFLLILSSADLLWKLMVNSLVGLLSLLLVNYFAAPFGFMLPVNIFTVAVAGLLGIPGILGLIFWQFWMF